MLRTLKAAFPPLSSPLYPQFKRCGLGRVPIKFNSGNNASGRMYLFHNTADAALAGNNGLTIKAPGAWQMIYARNNIWAGTAYAIENYNTSQPVKPRFR